MLALSPQDTYARYTLWLLTGREVEAFIRSRPQDVIDSALAFMRAGLNTEAASVLKTCTCPNQLVACYEAYVSGRHVRSVGDEALLPQPFGGHRRAGALPPCMAGTISSWLPVL